MIENTGFIVIIAYPETVVRTANGELISKIWPLFGVGGQQQVMAGHAAMLLISKETNKVHYFDFGRYITSNTFGRVRSEETDNEVHIPFSAEHNSKEIINLEEILLFLDRHPEKTHGEGRLVASVNHEINYDKALSYVLELQSKRELPYGAFKKEATNCARFVTDTIIASTTNLKVKLQLKKGYVLTPSPISNVLRGKSKNSRSIEIFQQHINSYDNKYIIHEHKKCLFSKVSQETSDVGSIKPDVSVFNSKTAQWLGGIGSGAWFELFKEDSKNNMYRIVRRNANGIIDLDDFFVLEKDDFSIDVPYVFEYGSNCKECFVAQNNKQFHFKRIKYLSA